MFFNSQLIKKSFRKRFFNNLIKILQKRFLIINLIKKRFATFLLTILKNVSQKKHCEMFFL
jgi:hypothetical protein